MNLLLFEEMRGCVILSGVSQGERKWFPTKVWSEYCISSMSQRLTLEVLKAKLLLGLKTLMMMVVVAGCWQARLGGVPLLHFWPLDQPGLGCYVSPHSLRLTSASSTLLVETIFIIIIVWGEYSLRITYTLSVL